MMHEMNVINTTIVESHIESFLRAITGEKIERLMWEGWTQWLVKTLSKLTCSLWCWPRRWPFNRSRILYSPNEQHVLRNFVPKAGVIIIRAGNEGGRCCGELSGCCGRLIIVYRCGVINFRRQLELNQQLRQKHRHDGFQEDEREHEDAIGDTAHPKGAKESVSESRFSVLDACLRQLLLPPPEGRGWNWEIKLIAKCCSRSCTSRQ